MRTLGPGNGRVDIRVHPTGGEDLVWENPCQWGKPVAFHSAADFQKRSPFSPLKNMNFKHSLHCNVVLSIHFVRKEVCKKMLVATYWASPREKRQ